MAAANYHILEVTQGYGRHGGWNRADLREAELGCSDLLRQQSHIFPEASMVASLGRRL